MTDFRKMLETDGTGFWRIPLGTNIGTDIDNETSIPQLALSHNRQLVEDRYKKLYPAIREPIAGYNCFGMVFALRRTSIRDPLLEMLMSEDGMSEIEDGNAKLGDIVVYYDSDGPTHAARIVRFVREAGVAKAIVLSKFDDVSGEYEHPLTDLNWDQAPYDISWKIYRERTATPQKWKDWKARLL